MNIPENYEIKGEAPASVMKWAGVMQKGQPCEFALREALNISQKANFAKCIVAVMQAMQEKNYDKNAIIAWMDDACVGNSSALGQAFAKAKELYITWQEIQQGAGGEVTIERKVSFATHFPSSEGRGKSCKTFIAGI